MCMLLVYKLPAMLVVTHAQGKPVFLLIFSMCIRVLPSSCPTFLQSEFCGAPHEAWAPSPVASSPSVLLAIGFFIMCNCNVSCLVSGVRSLQLYNVHMLSGLCHPHPQILVFSLF